MRGEIVLGSVELSLQLITVFINKVLIHLEDGLKGEVPVRNR